MGAKIEILANSNSAKTVGILYCGEMGSAFGKLLRKGGVRVITTCQGRSRATEEQRDRADSLTRSPLAQKAIDRSPRQR